MRIATQIAASCIAAVSLGCAGSKLKRPPTSSSDSNQVSENKNSIEIPTSGDSQSNSSSKDPQNTEPSLSPSPTPAPTITLIDDFNASTINDQFFITSSGININQNDANAVGAIGGYRESTIYINGVFNSATSIFYTNGVATFGNIGDASLSAITYRGNGGLNANFSNATKFVIDRYRCDLPSNIRVSFTDTSGNGSYMDVTLPQTPNNQFGPAVELPLANFVSINIVDLTRIHSISVSALQIYNHNFYLDNIILESN